MKYHVNRKTGRAGQCRATKKGCPLGVDTPHFDTKEEAKAFIEKSAKDENKTFSKLTKNNNGKASAKDIKGGSDDNPKLSTDEQSAFTSLMANIKTSPLPEGVDKSDYSQMEGVTHARSEISRIYQKHMGMGDNNYSNVSDFTVELNHLDRNYKNAYESYIREGNEYMSARELKDATNYYLSSNRATEQFKKELEQVKINNVNNEIKQANDSNPANMREVSEATVKDFNRLKSGLELTAGFTEDYSDRDVANRISAKVALDAYDKSFGNRKKITEAQTIEFIQRINSEIDTFRKATDNSLNKNGQNSKRFSDDKFLNDTAIEGLEYTKNDFINLQFNEINRRSGKLSDEEKRARRQEFVMESNKKYVE